MRLNVSLSRFISSIVLLMIVGGFLTFHLLYGQASPWSPTITDHQSSVSALWIRKDIYINPDDQAQMTTVNGKLILIASESMDNPFELIAMDANTGTTIWEYGDTNVSVITASQTRLFVGEVGKVIALKPNNGEIVWSTHLPFTRSVTKVLVRDNILHTDTVSGNHFLLEMETGKILQSISYMTDDVPIWSDHQMDLEFVGNIMYFQKHTRLPNGEVDINIIALDELSGAELWSSSVPAASRIAANSLGVFVLTLDGKLLRFDSVAGSKKELIQFTPAPLQRYYIERGTGREYGYHVAVDTDNHLIFVYLGDSAQLFAYRLPISP